MLGISRFRRALAARLVRRGTARVPDAADQPASATLSVEATALASGPHRRTRRAVRLAVLVSASGVAALAVGVGGVRAFLDFQAMGSSPDRILADGKQVYQSTCANCHGDDGARVPVAPLNAKAFLDSRGDATLVAVISDGKGAMPGWGKSQGGPLSPEQVRSVVAYLSNAAGHTSSTLLAASGRDVYQAQCASCHGDHADRIPIAPLNVKGYLDTRSDAQLLDVVAHGKGFMPSFGEKTSPKPLSDEQVRAVVSYLRYSVETALADVVSRGHAVYVDSCLGCHGEKGSRVPNVSLATPDYLRRVGDDPIVQAITYGKGSMPGLQKTRGDAFDGAAVTAVVAYLKSWAGLPAGGPVRPAGPSLGSPLAQAGPVTLEGAPASTIGQVRDVFLKDCGGCHGQTGDKVQKVQLASPFYLGARTDDQVIQAIQTSPGHKAAAAGASNPGGLSDADLRTILALLRLAGGPAANSPAAPTSVQPNGASGPSAAPQSAPATGDVAQGKDLFAKNCTVCHGQGGDQVPGVKLMDGTFLQQQGDVTVVQTITNGKGAMPTWGKAKGGSLSDDDIQNVVAYLKSRAGLSSGGPTAGPGSGAAPAGAPTGQAGAVQPGAAGTAATTAVGPAPASARLAGGATVVGAGGARAPPADAALVTHGKEIFSTNCVACHGEAGDHMPPARLNDPAWLQQKGDATLIQSITNGKGAMPTWGKANGGPLSPDDVLAVLAHVKTLGAPTAATAGNEAAAPTAAPTEAPSPDPLQPIVPVTAEVGAELFKANCTMCHGDDGLKIASVPLTSRSFGGKLSPKNLAERIGGGAPKAGMPRWSKSLGGQLSDSQIKAIVTYIKSVAAGEGP